MMKIKKKDGNSNNEKPKGESNISSSSPKEEILQGLYPYKLKMENSEATKTFLTYLFNKYTELNITQKKINKEKTMIKIILKLNKIGLASMGDKVEKYEIYANGNQPKIIWLGPKNFLVKNNLDSFNTDLNKSKSRRIITKNNNIPKIDRNIRHKKNMSQDEIYRNTSNNNNEINNFKSTIDTTQFTKTIQVDGDEESMVFINRMEKRIGLRSNNKKEEEKVVVNSP